MLEAERTLRLRDQRSMDMESGCSLVPVRCQRTTDGSLRIKQLRRRSAGYSFLPKSSFVSWLSLPFVCTTLDWSQHGSQEHWRFLSHPTQNVRNRTLFSALNIQLRISKRWPEYIRESPYDDDGLTQTNDTLLRVFGKLCNIKGEARQFGRWCNYPRATHGSLWRHTNSWAHVVSYPMDSVSSKRPEHAANLHLFPTCTTSLLRHLLTSMTQKINLCLEWHLVACTVP